ncbi:MAG TPA: YbfB/YjiJ family MFS transporter [Burkholderiales bacterium]|nr:YbfB/YjiJ family MFS transporter [Burkholderiales bacterium]
MSPAAVAAAGLAALAAGMGIGRFAFTPVLPLMQAEGTLTLAGGGWLAAANYAGYFAGALTASLVSASVAVRAGLLGVAFATLLMGLDTGFAGWIALRAGAGVASAWVLVHVSAWSLERLAPLSRPALSGAVYAGVGAGAVLAGALCVVALHLHLGARLAWFALGAIALVAAVALWPVFAEKRKDAVQTARHGWSPQALLLVACYGAFGFGYIIPATFIPAFARETLGDATLYAWAWPLFGAAAAASTVVVAPLLRRFGDRNVWIGSQLVMAGGVAAPFALRGIAGILVCALCVGTTFMVVTMAGLQEARRLFGAGVLAAMTAGFAAGQIAGPAFVSLLAHAGGRPEHAWPVASLALLAASAALFFRRSQP